MKGTIVTSRVAVATASLVPLGLATVLAQDAQAAAPQPASCPALDGPALSSGGTSCPVGPSGPSDEALSPLAIHSQQAGPTIYTNIQSNTGLNDIYIGEDFSCQVYTGGDYIFYPGGSGGSPFGDCGTFVAIGDGLYGPDFSEHGGGGTGTSEAIGSFGGTGTNYTPLDGTQSAVSGSGTQLDPYQVSTTEQNVVPGLHLGEVDTYIVGNDYYRTDITVTNTTGSPLSARVYRGGDCQFQHSGYVDTASGGVACAASANNSPPNQLDEFAPATAGSRYMEDAYNSVWSKIAAKGDLPDTCANCSTFDDSGDVGAALSWDVTVPAGGSTTVSALNSFSATGQPAELPIVTTGTASGVSQSAATLNGTVSPQGIAATNCVFEWGTSTAYGSSVPCAQLPKAGSTAVPVSASLSGLSPGSTYHYRLGATNAQYGTNWGADQSFTTAPASGAPTVASTSTPSVSTSGAALSGSVVPEGLLTSAQFEVGLDPKYLGGGPVTYSQSTPSQTVGSDFSAHNVTGSVSGLLPNALYHARLVASNADGTVDGPDVTFMTSRAPAPGAPTLGQTADLYPISGLIFVKPPNGKTIHGVRAVTAVAAIPKGQGFIPLTQARQVPVGSEIDALRGTLQLKLATAKKRRTQAATVNGSVFSLAQNRRGHLKGLTTFALKENAFTGAPSYTTCTTKKKTTRQPAGPLAQIAKLSRKVLQTLHASDRGGQFRTRGRYSAATVRGTDWFTEDRCDGTLTKVRRGSVTVQNFRTRKTIVLKAGHSFLAKRF